MGCVTDYATLESQVSAAYSVIEMIPTVDDLLRCFFVADAFGQLVDALRHAGYLAGEAVFAELVHPAKPGATLAESELDVGNRVASRRYYTQARDDDTAAHDRIPASTRCRVRACIMERDKARGVPEAGAHSR